MNQQSLHSIVTESRGLSRDDLVTIDTFAAAEKVTALSTLMAGFALLLHRYAGGRVVSFRAETTGRLQGHMEPGEAAPKVQVKVDPETTFHDLIRQTLDVRCIRASLNNTNPKLLSTPGAGTAYRAIDSEVRATVRESDMGLELRLECRPELFRAEYIGRILLHWELLVSSAVRYPNSRVGSLTMMSPEEIHRIVVDYNDTATDYGSDDPLHHHFERRAEMTPNAIALIFEGERMSYGELNQRANSLAHYLLSKGIGCESRVGICLERSFDLVVALLATLKAGAAYVPFDPDYPTARLNYMAADAEVDALLTSDYLSSRLETVTCRVVNVDAEKHAIGACRKDNPSQTIDGNNAAYMIYTSGSTGNPKGVVNTHRAICNRLLWMQGAYKLNSSDRVLQKTPFSFDVSVWEFFWPLMAGACMVLARPGGHRDPEYLKTLIIRDRITILHFVPSMLQVFLDYAKPVHCDSVRLVVCSGEALSWELYQRCCAKWVVPLENLYGPTEAAVDVTRWSCKLDRADRKVPIGKPIANLRIYTLDCEFNPVPEHLTGELYIAGAGLARGYWRRPALTAERFIPDPLTSIPGSRMYRTGDLACYLSDGVIQYIGRTDFQVKIRGHRIEITEIESVLKQHTRVRDCVVTACQDEAGMKYLAAYVVLSAGTLDAKHLRKFVEQRLPEYMIPAVYVELERLPMSPNGKLDRTALPVPHQLEERIDSSAVAADSVEGQLLVIWRQVLGVGQISPDSNFFDLGGHSLLLTQVANRIRQVFSVHVPLRILFDMPTLSEMAEVIVQAQSGAPEESELSTLLIDIAQLDPEEARKLLSVNA